eukprot:6213520-Pleurochrysis_carterae.AAC.1
MFSPAGGFPIPHCSSRGGEYREVELVYLHTDHVDIHLRAPHVRTMAPPASRRASEKFLVSGRSAADGLAQAVRGAKPRSHRKSASAMELSGERERAKAGFRRG